MPIQLNCSSDIVALFVTAEVQDRLIQAVAVVGSKRARSQTYKESID